MKTKQTKLEKLILKELKLYKEEKVLLNESWIKAKGPGALKTLKAWLRRLGASSPFGGRTRFIRDLDLSFGTNFAQKARNLARTYNTTVDDIVKNIDDNFFKKVIEFEYQELASVILQAAAKVVNTKSKLIQIVNARLTIRSANKVDDVADELFLAYKAYRNDMINFAETSGQLKSLLNEIEMKIFNTGAGSQYRLRYRGNEYIVDKAAYDFMSLLKNDILQNETLSTLQVLAKALPRAEGETTRKAFDLMREMAGNPGAGLYLTKVKNAFIRKGLGQAPLPPDAGPGEVVADIIKRSPFSRFAIYRRGLKKGAVKGVGSLVLGGLLAGVGLSSADVEQRRGFEKFIDKLFSLPLGIAVDTENPYYKILNFTFMGIFVTPVTAFLAGAKGMREILDFIRPDKIESTIEQVQSDLIDPKFPEKMKALGYVSYARALFSNDIDIDKKTVCEDITPHAKRIYEMRERIPSAKAGKDPYKVFSDAYGQGVEEAYNDFNKEYFAKALVVFTREKISFIKQSAEKGLLRKVILQTIEKEPADQEIDTAVRGDRRRVVKDNLRGAADYNFFRQNLPSGLKDKINEKDFFYEGDYDPRFGGKLDRQKQLNRRETERKRYIDQVKNIIADINKKLKRRGFELTEEMAIACGILALRDVDAATRNRVGGDDRAKFLEDMAKAYRLGTEESKKFDRLFEKIKKRVVRNAYRDASEARKVNNFLSVARNLNKIHYLRQLGSGASKDSRAMYQDAEKERRVQIARIIAESTEEQFKNIDTLTDKQIYDAFPDDFLEKFDQNRDILKSNISKIAATCFNEEREVDEDED